MGGKGSSSGRDSSSTSDGSDNTYSADEARQLRQQNLARGLDAAFTRNDPMAGEGWGSGNITRVPQAGWQKPKSSKKATDTTDTTSSTKV